MKRVDYLSTLSSTMLCVPQTFLLQYSHCDWQMPLTMVFPGPLSVFIMDNARIHHGMEILELAERFGE